MSIWRIGAEAAAPTHGLPYESPLEVTRERGVGSDRRKRQPNKGAEAVFDRLTKWIPGDTLALYVPFVTFLATPSVALLIVMILATPLFVLGAAFATGGKFTKRVWVSAVLGMVAFAIWSVSVPQSGWQRWPVVVANQALFAFGGAILGSLFGYAAEGIVKRLE